MTSISSASPAFTGRDPDNRLFGPLPDVQGEAGYEEDHPARVGFFTDTSVCIGCKVHRADPHRRPADADVRPAR